MPSLMTPRSTRKQNKRPGISFLCHSTAAPQSDYCFARQVSRSTEDTPNTGELSSGGISTKDSCQSTPCLCHYATGLSPAAPHRSHRRCSFTIPVAPGRRKARCVDRRIRSTYETSGAAQGRENRLEGISSPYRHNRTNGYRLPILTDCGRLLP